MINRISYLLALAVLFAVEAMAQSPSAKSVWVKGHVFEDKNNNGMQDKGEKGLSKVLISNGVHVISSDSRGAYAFEAEVGQSIFSIHPSAYQYANANKIGNANVYYLNPNNHISDTLVYNMPLQKRKSVPKDFNIAAIGDVQVSDQEELGFAAKSIFSELLERNDIDFNLVLGDLVNNNMDILPDFGDILGTLPMTSWTMVGNHDRNVDHPAYMNDRFNTVFGADNYAFNYGHAHFIVLNNVFATGKNSYEGRLTDDQLTFLKNDLAHVPKDVLVVLSQHIPMAFTRNKAEVLQQLEGYENVLLLSGHTHQVDRYFFKSHAIQELGAGATCGNWWRGEKDAFGVPDAMMQCGSPRGYFVIHIKDNQYTFKYKAIGQDAQKQMHITLNDGLLQANIFGAGDSTKVLVQLNDGEWLQMQLSKSIDPLVAHIIEKNNQKIYPSPGSTVNPLRKRKSSHLWELPIPQLNANRNKIIRIKAQDSYGFSVQNEFMEYFSK